MTYAKRIDANQSEIVQAFERLGFSVVDLSRVGGGCPDLAISVHGVTWLVEVKTAEGTLDPSQIRFHRENKAHIEVCRSLADVERIAKAMKAEAFGKGVK